MPRILVIDDSWLTRRGIAGILSNGGFDIAEAENGAEGVVEAERQPCDCILLDLLMPEMDGYAVLEALREKGIDIPVIVCSADIQDTAREKCYRLGAAGFVNKPPDSVELLNTINTIIRKR